MAKKNNRSGAPEKEVRFLNKDYKGDQAEKKARLSLFYKIAGGYTLLAALAYTVVQVIYNKGYMLINTTLQYWLWYALVIGVILLVGRLLSDFPKNPGTKKIMRVISALMSLFLLLSMYVQCITMIDNGFHKYAIVKSENGENEVVIMRCDLHMDDETVVTGSDKVDDSEVVIVATAEPGAATAEPAAEPTAEPAAEGEATEEVAKVYTLYKAYPRLNKYFCDGRGVGADEMIWLIDDEEAAINGTWSEDGMTYTLTTEGNVMILKGEDTEQEGEMLNSITVVFE